MALVEVELFSGETPRTNLVKCCLALEQLSASWESEAALS